MPLPSPENMSIVCANEFPGVWKAIRGMVGQGGAQGLRSSALGETWEQEGPSLRSPPELSLACSHAPEAQEDLPPPFSSLGLGQAQSKGQ